MEVNKPSLKSLVRQTFGCEPFDWQIATAIAVLEGRDIILDVGTGSGKTLAFSLASVLNTVYYGSSEHHQYSKQLHFLRVYCVSCPEIFYTAVSNIDE